MQEPVPPAPTVPPRAAPVLVILDPGLPTRAREAAPAGPGTVEMASWPEFLLSGREPAGFYLRHCGEDAQRDLLARAIRASAFWDRPAFCDPAHAPGPLLDGAAEPAPVREACERAAALRASLRLDTAAMHIDERLLFYLYLREPGEFAPVLDRGARGLYRYPVAEALARPGEDADAWLATLVRRQLLAPGTLIDRTRHCRNCGSAHLHFLDVCPHCGSIQIRRAASLHCFTCGHVAPEADFRTEAGMVCPKCAARLRHIGVDYDRPLTQYACASCHHSFVEAGVVARCLDCATQADPETLDVREVATLRLTSHGRAALRAGQIHESFASLDLVNHVVPNYFRHLVDWALATQARHAEFGFGLMLIEFLNAAELVEAHGASRAFLMIDEFARRLHELLRQSDVSTRTTEERLWLFLPFSSAAGLAARVRGLEREQAPPQGPPMRLALRHLQAPGQVGAGEGAAELMARLEHDGGGAPGG